MKEKHYEEIKELSSKVHSIIDEVLEDRTAHILTEIQDKGIQQMYVHKTTLDDGQDVLHMDFRVPEIDYNDEGEPVLKITEEEGLSWGVSLANAAKEWMEKNPNYDREWVYQQLLMNLKGISHQLADALGILPWEAEEE